MMNDSSSSQRPAMLSTERQSGMRQGSNAATHRPRVLFVGLPSFRESFAEDLLRELMQGQLQHDVVAVTTPKPSIYESEAGYRNVEFVQKDALEYIERIENLYAACRFALSQDLIERHLDSEYTYLSISDRNSIGDQIPVYRRRRAFRQILAFWYEFLIDRNIEAVILVGYPHAGWNNVLVDVAKALSLRLVLVDFTVIGNTTLVSELSRAYESVSSALYAGLSTDQVRQAVPQGLLARAQAPLFGSEYSKEVKKQVNEVGLGNSYWSLLKSAVRRPFLKVRPSFTRLNGGLTRLSMAALTFSARKRVTKQLAAYKAVATNEPNLTGKYIYFPLHLQPERSTSPAGGFFDDQLLAAEILSASLPDDWALLIKEHPSQFWQPRAVKQSDFRSENFYARLAALPRTKLIAFEYDSHTLIDNAEATATITGTAGWETMMQGKACLAFGRAWYHGCAACFPIDSVDNCKQALERISKMSQQDVERQVLEFLLHYSDRILPVPFLPDRATLSSTDYQMHTRAIAGAVSKELLGSADGEGRRHAW